MGPYMALQAARKGRPDHVLDATVLRRARRLVRAGGLGVDQALRCAVAGHGRARVSESLVGSSEWHRTCRSLLNAVGR